MHKYFGFIIANKLKRDQQISKAKVVIPVTLCSSARHFICRVRISFLNNSEMFPIKLVVTLDIFWFLCTMLKLLLAICEIYCTYTFNRILGFCFQGLRYYSCCHLCLSLVTASENQNLNFGISTMKTATPSKRTSSVNHTRSITSTSFFVPVYCPEFTTELVNDNFIN